MLAVSIEGVTILGTGPNGCEEREATFGCAEVTCELKGDEPKAGLEGVPEKLLG